MVQAPIQAPAILIYGPSGVGKTVAALKALTPEKTLWISTERGALKPASSPLLNPFHPRRPREVVCLHAATGKADGVHGEVRDAIIAACAEVRAGTVSNIVIDTLSSYARRLDHYIRDVIGVGREYGKAADAIGSHLLPYLDRIYELCATAQRPSGMMGATLVALCHERDPFQPAADRHTGAAAKATPGGADLPGALAKKIRHDFDLVLRADIRAVEGGTAKRVFVHDSTDKMFPTKDRWAILPDKGNGQGGIIPMDLGAILRCGFAQDAGRKPDAADLAILNRFERGGDGAASRGASVEDLVSI